MRRFLFSPAIISQDAHIFARPFSDKAFALIGPAQINLKHNPKIIERCNITLCCFAVVAGTKQHTCLHVAAKPALVTAKISKIAHAVQRFDAVIHIHFQNFHHGFLFIFSSISSTENPVGMSISAGMS